jgi:hypothetical protein
MAENTTDIENSREPSYRINLRFTACSNVPPQELRSFEASSEV